MKKVLFIATVVKIHINVFHLPYIEWFKKQDWQVDVAAKNDFENPNDCYIPNADNYFNIPFDRSPFGKNNIKAYKQLKNIIDRNEYDIIHCHTPMGGVIARLAARDSRKKGTRVIYTAHGFHFSKESPKKNWALFYPIEHELARYTDTLITINKEDYKIAKRFPAKQIELVHGVGIDLKKIDSIHVDSKDFRRKNSIPEQAYVILSIGELNDNKNHKVIIEALGKIKDPNIHYVICGQGTNEKFLKNRSKELGIDKNVHFMGFRNDVLKFYQVANVFAFPSKREGLSLSLMEAMASGLPAIVSDIRGNTDLIVPNKGGLLLDINNTSDVASKILRIKSNEEFQIKASNFNKERIKKFSLDSVMKEMEKIYNINFSNNKSMVNNKGIQYE